jgi:fatty acid desaturase/SAM-dependent methyltransferase
MGAWGGWLLAPMTGVWLGFCAASLVNFLHEAAHYNIHRDKKVNDGLANWLIGAWVGQEVSKYRKVHWAHHLYLGSPQDTEVSYHNAPTPGFLLLNLCGLHALRVLARRRSFLEGDSIPSRSWHAYLRSVALHGSVLTAILISGHLSLCLAWCVCWFLFFPFFTTLRQILEHRDLAASPDIDFKEVEHGPKNRLFGTDYLSRLFGSAGFNRHLLHHWDPAISYTRFDEMIEFMKKTALAESIDTAQTSYTRVLREMLMRSTSNGPKSIASEPCPVCASLQTHFFAYAWDSEYQTSQDRFTYKRCLDCAALFLSQPPTDRLREIYPRNYYAYTPVATQSLLHRIKNHLDGQMFRHIVREIPGAGPIAVLDVGGGTGWLAKLIRSQNPRVNATHVVDLDESAQSVAEADGHGFSACRIEDFTASRSFDLILMLNLIEHVADPASVLLRLRDVLSVHGRLLIKTPNTESLSCRLFRNNNWGGFHCPRHWVLFQRKNFEALAARCGLRVLWTKYTQGAPQWTTSILGWLADHGWIRITSEQPAHTHRLYTPLLALFALLDSFLIPIIRPSQMFVLLERDPAVGKEKAEWAA